MQDYQYRHVVGFQETNLVGNVYFTHHLSWQGRCRELFLREYAPGVLDDMARGLKLITTRCSCEYFQELAALDEVVVHMRLAALLQNRMTLQFEYRRADRDGVADELIARGEQQVAFMRLEDQGLVPAPVPEELRTALQRFGG